MSKKDFHKYKVIGLMSGTSLDGLDIASCTFKFKNKKWSFSIDAAETIRYSNNWRKKLTTAHLLSGEQIQQLNSEYGSFLGTQCNQFIQKNYLKIDLISSHGHTVFHQPKNKFTYQLGDGNAIHSITQLPVVFDFRSLDVTLGGEGAPLVPIGDQLLFSDYDVCINLGGIANLSMNKKRNRIAFDICYCNMALNYLANKSGKAFDNNGAMAAKGKIDENLLRSLKENYSRLRKKKPSLGREIFEKDFLNLLNDNSISISNRLRTVCQSIVDEIALVIPNKKLKILITGGGAHNKFLIELLQQKLSKSKIIVPNEIIINFKESLVFAFLGVLRIRNEINVLKSVTRAKKDSCSGVLIG